MAAFLKDIVEGLNNPPFSLNLSIVGFDEKQPFELLQTLNVVLEYLDSQLHKTDLRDEDPESMYRRIAQFLMVLGFTSVHGENFRDGLITGDKKIIYPVLSFLLKDLSRLKKRAYLGRFLVEVELPPEIPKDEALQDCLQQYAALQCRFKVTHAALQETKTSGVTPSKIQYDIQQLESEKEQLRHKISNLKERISNQEGFQRVFSATSSLRKEQEEEARLSDRFQEQRLLLEGVEEQYSAISQQLHGMSASTRTAEVSPETMLNTLTEEASRNRTVLDQLDSKIQETNSRATEIEISLAEPSVNLEQIGELELQVSSLQDDLARKQAENVAVETTLDSSLAIYKQQANLVSSKMRAAVTAFQELEERSNSLVEQLRRQEDDYKALRGHTFLTREEFKEYANTLRTKTTMYKQLKAELAEIRGDVAILGRTEQILQQQADEQKAQMKNAENERGITGYQETEMGLEEASIQKAQIDQAKGGTLDEMSRIVSEIAQQLQMRKKNLAPQIKRLKQTRETHQALEQQYKKKKNVYDPVLFGKKKGRLHVSTNTTVGYRYRRRSAGFPSGSQ
eukprot:GHVQ01008471.1.p1 GENE.GHVQ01008471.1~~GHVQ01008471.1.p1  ORF type:complete len:567 (-),score=87.88 GHVQ01008471.1:2457-4157(-)